MGKGNTGGLRMGHCALVARDGLDGRWGAECIVLPQNKTGDSERARCPNQKGGMGHRTGKGGGVRADGGGCWQHSLWAGLRSNGRLTKPMARAPKRGTSRRKGQN